MVLAVRADAASPLMLPLVAPRYTRFVFLSQGKDLHFFISDAHFRRHRLWWPILAQPAWDRLTLRGRVNCQQRFQQWLQLIERQRIRAIRFRICGIVVHLEK